MGLRDKLVLLALAAAVAAPAQVLDRIAVVVGKDVITETEVLQEARLEAFLNQTSPELGPDARKAAADRLINQQLVRNEMTIGAYPEPTDAEVESALRSFRQEHFSSIPLYRASLQKYGLDEQTLKKHLRWQLAAIRFTDMRFTPAVPGDGSADRAVATPAGDRSANRPSGGAPASPNETTDDRFEQWLKQARSATKIQIKAGAFQ